MDNKLNSLYDSQKRGAEAPQYSTNENRYRSDLLNKLQMCYKTREKRHMELNDKTYSEYYLINRQQDRAYNPPKVNPNDSRIVTGIIHEKDNTIESIITSMNLMPVVEFYDTDNDDYKDFSNFLTAKLRKSLEKENFKNKLRDYVRTNISQGNVFIQEQRVKKDITKKVPVGNINDPSKLKWNTVVEACDEYCESMLIPNTAVYFPNFTEADLKMQPYLFICMNIPRVSAEQMFGKYERWKNVPKFPTMTTPKNTDGIWGDFYLQQPQTDYVEIIIYQNKPENEYQLFINGVMFLPIDEYQGKITGFPLTFISPSGEYTIVKGDNERIPLFPYGLSIPAKNEVKEEVANEFLRIAVHKFRYSAFPSVGNNSDKILPASIWDPSEVIPDLREEDISILNPNGTLTQADFSFYNLVMNSIDETSVSKSLEGANNSEITATQYVDQKRENLKKLGISIDGVIEFLKDFFWLRLMNEIYYLDTKKKTYSEKDGKMIEMYESFMSEMSVDGDRRSVKFNMVEEIPELNPVDMFQEEYKNPLKPKNIYIKPKEAKEFLQKVKDKMYISVVSEPEGQNQSLLGILFNNLTAYANLRGGSVPNLNFEFIDKIIDENSGFEKNKLFTKVPIDQMNQMFQPQMEQELEGVASQAGVPGVPQRASKPKPPANNILANSA